MSNFKFLLKYHMKFSDMDASDCDRKRTEFIEEIMDLENQFSILREQ